MSKALRILVVDASVLIDYAEVAPEALTLLIAAGTELIVPSPIFDDEVNALSEDDATAIGLILEDPTIQQMTEAGERAVAGGGLSFHDWLCFIMARDGDDWVVLTNDALLRRTCTSEGISTTRGLRLLLDLVNTGHLATREAGRIGRAMCAANPTLGKKVLELFLKELRK